MQPVSSWNTYALHPHVLVRMSSARPWPLLSFSGRPPWFNLLMTQCFLSKRFLYSWDRNTCIHDRLNKKKKKKDNLNAVRDTKIGLERYSRPTIKKENRGRTPKKELTICRQQCIASFYRYVYLFSQ